MPTRIGFEILNWVGPLLTGKIVKIGIYDKGLLNGGTLSNIIKSCNFCLFVCFSDPNLETPWPICLKFYGGTWVGRLGFEIEWDYFKREKEIKS